MRKEAGTHTLVLVKQEEVEIVFHQITNSIFDKIHKKTSREKDESC